ncbi:hypothetical protein [Streptomyces sp. NBC_01207]|nr:hypothetical protein OG457_38840 [Streptomyces sp. NBC_01207]
MMRAGDGHQRQGQADGVPGREQEPRDDITVDQTQAKAEAAR